MAFILQAEPTHVKDFARSFLRMGRMSPSVAPMKTIDQELRLSVADTVNAERARRRLTQQDLANAIGVSRAGVSERLRGAVPFDTDELAAIGGLLDMPPAEILEIAWEAIRGTP